MLDYVLKGGTVVDGTGVPARQADVGIKDGRIAKIGKISDSTAESIDVAGLIVAPGFVDIHTHYDGQVNWDPELTPSSWHGVTSIIGGNCGFSVAPLVEDSSEYVMEMLSVVEGIPYSALRLVDASWRSFGSWLGRLDGNVALNAGFFCGHSTLRRAVMGEGAIGDQTDESGPAPGAEATPEQIEAMKQLLQVSLEEGAIGFSTSRAGHTDQAGFPVASRAASRQELIELCSVVGGFEGMTIGFSPDELFSDHFSENMYSLLIEMAVAAKSPLITNGPTGGKQAAADRAAEQGAVIRGMYLTHPNVMRMNLLDGLVWDATQGWNRTMHLPFDKKVRALSDPGVREKLLEGARSRDRAWTNFGDLVIFDVQSPELGRLVGRRVGDIAAERGADPFDTFLDIALADNLETGFRIPGRDETAPDFWQQAAEAMRDPRLVMGGSDAGAHLNMVASYDIATHLIARAVRELQIMSMEEAVHVTTEAPARLFGLRDRGRLAEGWHADISVFDAEQFTPAPFTVRHDLPGGSWRLTSEAEGLHYVFVNGVKTYVDNKFTGALPGTILRGGRDTQAARQ